ncbi:hypothetical protein CsSME_00022750 [Camellia sinensis var. sinensis]
MYFLVLLLSPNSSWLVPIPLEFAGGCSNLSPTSPTKPNPLHHYHLTYSTKPNPLHHYHLTYSTKPTTPLSPPLHLLHLHFTYSIYHLLPPTLLYIGIIVAFNNSTITNINQ